MRPEHEKIVPAGLTEVEIGPELVPEPTPETAPDVSAPDVAPTGADYSNIGGISDALLTPDDPELAELFAKRNFRRQLAISALAGCAMNLDGRHLLDMARDAWALADAMLYSEEEDQSDLWPYEAKSEIQVETETRAEPQPEPEPEPIPAPWPFKTPEQLRAEAVEAARQAHNARIARLQATPETESQAPAKPVSLFAAWSAPKS